MTPERLIDDLADAVADGTTVDWDLAETQAGTAGSLVRHLRLVASVAQAQRDVLPPESWGPLRLDECVGRGSFGEVYRAWDATLQRKVALKLLPAPLSTDPDHPVLREARLLARVRHPNVVTIHGAEQIDDRIGLWMELVPGRTLEQLIRSGTTFTPADTIAIGIELCRALSAVHAAGLLHRDVKAHNVMREENGRIVLMDFGTGRDRADVTASDLSGTPLYLAPEVLAGRPASVRSDIYSLGVLLYRLLTGDYPIKARTLEELRREHARNERTDRPPPRAGLPAELMRVVARALEPRPDRRYADADAMATSLAALPDRPAKTRWVRGLAVATAFALVVAGAAAATTWSRGGGSTVDDAPLLAVMPLRDLGGDPNSSTMADGMTVGLIQELARLDGLLVNSLESSFALKAASRSVRDVSRDLGASYVVTGSVEMAGGLLRVSAQLVRPDNDTPIWSDHFDRPLKSARDVFDVRDDIARAISNALRLKLGRGQRRYDTTTLPLPVYYEFTRAQQALIRGGPVGAREAVALFDAVVKDEPLWAPAWAGLASAQGAVIRLSGQDAGLATPNDITRLRAAAAKAIEIDPMLPDAHAAMGVVFAHDRNWSEAEAAFKRALAGGRNRPSTAIDYALTTLLPLRRLDEALARLAESRRASPLSLDVQRTIATMQVESGRYDAAIRTARAIVARDPTIAFASKLLARALALSGRFDEALAILEPDAGEWAMQAWIYARQGDRARAEAIARQHPHRPGRLMLIYAGLGDTERTFAAFETFLKLNWWLATHQVQRPELSLLWSDPRVTAIRRELGLPPI